MDQESKEQAHTLGINVTEFIKRESQVIQSQVINPEDVFKTYYSNGEIIQPKYDLRALWTVGVENNALTPCINAYATNIDGSGMYVETPEKDKIFEATDAKSKEAVNLFEFTNEVYPETSLLTLRTSLRWHLELTGNGYLEVIRNALGEIIFLNMVPSYMVRLCNLGNPIIVTKKVKRYGKEQNVLMRVRERRYAQIIGTELVYFKCYGASRDVNATTGEWIEGKEKPNVVKGNELIHFTVYEDIDTPYGVPRWISQIPSAVGSRAAEEYNLEHFNSGGVPPVLVFLAGGSASPESRQQITNIFSGKAKKKNRGAVVEVVPTTGTIDKEGKVQVTVEKFTQDKDAMFDKYDDKCELKIRSSYRLPPLFVGRIHDYTFASAYASYIVAEAQVFSPERDEFDDKFNRTVVNELAPGHKVKSKPISVKDIEQFLNYLKLAKEAGGNPEDVVNEINDILGTTISVTEEATASTVGGGTTSTPNVKNRVIKSVEKFNPLVKLATECYTLITNESSSQKDLDKVLSEIEELPDEQQTLVKSFISAKAVDSSDDDLDLGNICGCGC